MNGGYDNSCMYDPLAKTLRDDTPELGFGVKIDNYFIERERLSMDDMNSVNSLFNLNLLRGSTFYGMDADVIVFDKSGFDKKEVMRLKCYQSFLRKNSINSNSNDMSRLSTTVLMLGFWLLSH